MRTMKLRFFKFQYDKNDKIIKDNVVAYFKDCFISGHEDQGKKIILDCITEGNRETFAYIYIYKHIYINI